MRQSKAAGRALGNARRVALTSLGAGLAVSAAAPFASAATVADTAPPAANAIAPAADTASMANSVPLTSAAESAQSAVSAQPAASANLDPTVTLADGALTASTAALKGSATAGWSRLGRFKLYPLAGTGVDPLSNVVGTSLGGIPVSTQPVTAMVSDGLPVSDLPVVGALFNGPQG
jgi:hypothetical protein